MITRSYRIVVKNFFRLFLSLVVRVHLNLHAFFLSIADVSSEILDLVGKYDTLAEIY